MVVSKFVKQQFYITWQLAKTSFKLRYNGSVMGYMWAVLKPLFIFTILNFVFSHFFGTDDPYYSIKLLTSIVIWTFFVEGTTSGIMSLIYQAGILTKIKVSKLAIIFAASLHVYLSFVVNSLLVFAFYPVYGFVPSISSILIYFLYSLLIYAWILAITIVLAPLIIRFRDINQIWEVVSTAGFYAAPIIYPMSMIPQEFHLLLQINPMTFIIQYVQETMFNDFAGFSMQANLIYIAYTLGVLVVSYFLFKLFSKRINELV